MIHEQREKQIHNQFSTIASLLKNKVFLKEKGISFSNDISDNEIEFKKEQTLFKDNIDGFIVKIESEKTVSDSYSIHKADKYNFIIMNDQEEPFVHISIMVLRGEEKESSSLLEQLSQITCRNSIYLKNELKETINGIDNINNIYNALEIESILQKTLVKINSLVKNTIDIATKSEQSSIEEQQIKDLETQRLVESTLSKINEIRNNAVNQTIHKGNTI